MSAVRLAVVLGLCIALTAPAAAQQPSPDLRLRGAEASEKSRTEAPAPVAPAAAATPAAASRTADQCRATCAQAYYFCLAGESPEACPDAWSQCRIGCSTRSDALSPR